MELLILEAEVLERLIANKLLKFVPVLSARAKTRIEDLELGIMNEQCNIIEWKVLISKVVQYSIA